MKAVAWLSMGAEATCACTRMGQWSVTEATMVLQSLAILPSKEQAVDHDEVQATPVKAWVLAEVELVLS
jgi:hypothetical protein